MITPTDPEGADDTADVPSGSEYYQLTHDYLVPSLREWLTRKQRETRKGRAELKLDERAATWNAQRENKQLPTLWEWLSIRSLTASKKWTQSQRVMMTRATRFHGLRSVLALAGLVVLVFIGAVVRTEFAEQQEATRIEGLVGSLLKAEPNQIGDIVDQLDDNPEVALAVTVHTPCKQKIAGRPNG